MANKEAVFSLRVDTGSSVQQIQKLDQELSNINKDSNDAQDQFNQLTSEIKKTSELVDKLSKSFGENSLEADNARKELSKLTTAYDELSKSATDTGATFEDIYGDLQPLTTRMGEAEDRLYELALAGDTTSKEYQDLLATVVKFRKAQIETDMVVDNAAKTFGEKLAGGIGTATELFSGFESVTALVGVENENLVQTMVKLQAVQGLAASIQEIQNKLKEKDALLTGVQTVAQKVYTLAVGQSVGAMKALRVALLATGIGAIIVALAAAADALGLFGESSEEAEKAQAKLDEQIKNTTNSLKEQQSLTNELIQSTEKDTARLVAQAKLRGDSEKEVSRIKSEQSGLQRRLLANDVESAKKAYYKALNDRKVTLDQLTEFENLYFGSKKKLRDFDSANEIKVLENAVKVQENSRQKQKEANDKARDAAEKARDQRKEDLAKIQEVEEAYALAGESLKNQEIITETKKYNELIKLAEKNGYDTTTLRLALRDSLNNIDNKYDDIQRANEERRAKEQKDLEIAEKNRKEAIRREDIAIEEAFFDEYNAALLSAQQTEEQAVNSKYFILKEGAEKYGLDIIRLTELNEQEITKIQNKYQAERLQKQLDNAQFVFDQLSALNDAFSALEDARMQNMQTRANDELSALDAKHKKELEGQNLTADQKKAIDDKYAAAKYQIELKNFNALEAIKKKQFERDKILRIGQAAIDTASAIVKGIAQFGPPPSPAGIAAIASAALIGATQIAAIAATKYQSGTAPTFDTSGGVSAGASANELGGANANTNTQQTDLTGLAAQQSAGINQVYVLESDITGTQNNVAIQNKLSVW
jgi:hypothetical protein